MTHTPNTDASERERLSAHEIAAANLASLIDGIDCFDNDVLREAIELLRADANLREQLAARSAEVEALRKDAERYRWLRDEGDKTWRPLAPNPFNRGEIDRAIDAALQEKSRE